MKKNQRIKILFSVLIAVFLFALSEVYILDAAMVDRTIAVVNDEVITEGELNEILNPIYEQLNETYRGDELEFYSEQARKEVLERLIEDRLILQEARRQKILVTSDDINQKLSELREKFSSDEEFEKSMAGSSMTMGRLKERIREQLMMARFFDKEICSKIVVNPQEITNYFRNNPDKFRNPQRVRVRNITTKFKNSTERLSANRKIKEALSLLKQGKDFKEVARQYSEGTNAESGGELGLIKKGEMRDEIDRIIFNLKEGEISDIIETESAFNIFFVEEKIASHEKNLEEVKDQIQHILFQEKLKERFNEWVEKLKKDAYISIR
ncbi:MAG: hypothetical protein FJZ16_09450 [Candidatus Omnitrophica bacterium]|nr:hypothetical protein [Candidatus Omnitrophota bacterium]